MERRLPSDAREAGDADEEEKELILGSLLLLLRPVDLLFMATDDGNNVGNVTLNFMIFCSVSLNSCLPRSLGSLLLLPVASRLALGGARNKNLSVIQEGYQIIVICIFFTSSISNYKK